MPQKSQLAGTMIQLFSGLVLIILLFTLQQAYRNRLNRVGQFNVPQPVERLPRCTPWNGSPCKTIVYAIQSEFPISPSNQADQVVGLIAGANNLTIVSNVNEEGDIAKFESYQAIYNFVLANPNQTQSGIVFTLDSASKIVSYRILYNDSFNYDTGPIETSPTVDVTPSLLLSIDNALLKSEAPQGQIESLCAGFPVPYPRFITNDIVTNSGAFWFYCPPMFIFILVLNQIVLEKELKVRQAMKTMGLRNLMFWSSWFFTGLIVSALSILVLFASGAAFGFVYFTNTNFFANFLAFFLFSMSAISMSMFVSTMLAKSDTSNIIGFIIFITGLLIQIIFTSIAIYVWYAPSFNRVWRALLVFYPPFNLAKCIADFSALAADVYSPTAGKFVAGPGQQLFSSFHLF